MSESSNKTKILDASNIAAKLKRIAFEIAENNYGESELYLIGIKKRGTQIANVLAEHLKSIVSTKIEVSTISINKQNPINDAIKYSEDLEKLNDKVVILVDDVADSGRTLCYSIKPLLNHLPKKIQIAVLIDRMHKKFPIQADYVGTQLSTSLQEYVKVKIDGEALVYLE